MRQRPHQKWVQADGVDDPLTGERIHWKPIGDVRPRERVAVSGTVAWTRVDEWAGGPVFDVSVSDGTGAINLYFLGRRRVDGICPGTHLSVAGTAGLRHERLVMLNPDHHIDGVSILIAGDGAAMSPCGLENGSSRATTKVVERYG